MQTIFHPAGARGYADHGWLKTYHSFSFADYYDPEKMGFGALRVINDDTIAPGQGFGRHPHRDMEIITIPLSGALAHEDNVGQPAGATPTALLAGNREVIETGEIQVMSAGTGVVHSEFNASQTDPVSLLQIWILTRAAGVMPRYAQKPFDQNLFKNTFHLIVGPEESEKSGALFIHQDAFLSFGAFEVGETVKYALKNKEHGVYVFVTEGRIAVAGKTLGTRDALGVWEADAVTFEIQASAEVLLIEVPMAI